MQTASALRKLCREMKTRTDIFVKICDVYTMLGPYRLVKRPHGNERKRLTREIIAISLVMERASKGKKEKCKHFNAMPPRIAYVIHFLSTMKIEFEHN